MLFPILNTVTTMSFNLHVHVQPLTQMHVLYL